MPKHEVGANRHQMRVWLKWAIESGLLDKLPPQYDPDDSQTTQPTDRHARQLLAELRDPDSSTRRLSQVLADARRFRAWVEFRQKISRRIILAETQIQSEGAGATVLEGQPSTRTEAQARSDPMWDDWLDA